MGKNMLGIEDHVAWVTPGDFTVSNVPCSEDGLCGDQIQGKKKKIQYVAQQYIDPSVYLTAKE